MNEFEKNILNYIDQYNWEKQLFLKGVEWKKKGWLTKTEFLEICLWKSRRPKNLYNSNEEIKIKQITQNVFNQNDEIEKINLLIKLKGVSIPTASAILSVTNPQEYPIIDIRCVEALKELELISWKTINTNNWIDYLKIIREFSKKYKKSAREIEQGLFAFNRINLDKQFKNLYKNGNSKTKNV